MSGIDTYYAAVDAYDAYQAGELGAEEIINLGLAATGTILSTGAVISSGRGLYKLMGSDGVGCKVLTGITGEPHCFIAGTLVSTEEGQRAIEEVEAGDKVWAYVLHIGWQTGCKRGSGGAERGHIFVDDVLYNR